jgi:fucose permease
MNLLLPLMIALLLITGLGAALLGSFKVALERRLNIDEARVGGLVSLFGFAMIPVIFTAGFLTDRFGPSAVLIGGSLLLAGSLAVLGLARGYGAALAAVVLLSAGWSLLINVGNVLTPHAFPGNTAFATNLANVFFGLGAFLTPLLVAGLLSRLSFTAVALLIAGVALVPAILALGIDFRPYMPSAATSTAPETGIGTLLADPMLWLCGLALFFYGPLEACVSAWSTSYLGEQGVKETAAAGLLSGFWLMFMASRLLTAFVLPAGAEAYLILVLGLVSSAVVAFMVVSRSRGLAMALVPAAGFVFGPIFPTLMAILLGHFAAQVHGRAVGLLFAIGGVGWTVIPMILGSYARRTSVQRGLAVAVVTALGVSAVAAALVAMR